ncbi:hypothetical protein RA280_31435 [Cupriavidus sp. CV2]|uniref:hypothetical protein n=1 Tax=Cupriavidus ulmosensis TaxID=3065913 RepID=UPI00296B3C93|nr:hypothetical protein [Cupriavidus sp. CV2]MDW3686176.1 hypothetical protein [Cupriavidus sp. CV2]
MKHMDAEPEDIITDATIRVTQAAGQQPDSGLKPIKRLISEDRLSRIVPETQTTMQLSFSTTFVRDFVRADYSFCSAKFSVSRGGKVKAIDEAFRHAEAWFEGAHRWADRLEKRTIPLQYHKRELLLTHALSGRLLRLLRHYDTLSSKLTFALMVNSVDGLSRDNALGAAGHHIAAIHALCMPDNDQFQPDGTRRGTDQ